MVIVACCFAVSVTMALVIRSTIEKKRAERRSMRALKAALERDSEVKPGQRLVLVREG